MKNIRVEGNRHPTMAAKPDLTFIMILILGALVGCGTQHPGTSLDTRMTQPDERKGANIAEEVRVLLSQKNDTCLDISHVSTNDIVQVAYFPVAKDGAHLQVQVCHAFWAPPQPGSEIPKNKVLVKLGICVPEGWTLLEFDPGCSIRYQVPIAQADSIPGFVCDVFSKLYNIHNTAELKYGSYKF